MTSAWEAMRMSGKAVFAAIDPDNTSYATLNELVAELNIAVHYEPALASLVEEISLLDTLVLDVDEFNQILEKHVQAAAERERYSQWDQKMGSRCSSLPRDDDQGKQAAGGLGSRLVLEAEQASLTEEAPCEHLQSTASPHLMVHSAALEGWGCVPHLQFQAFAAAAGTHPITMMDWHRRSALVNRFALVCKDWWQAVAPADGPFMDSRLRRRIGFTGAVTAADMRPWWTVVEAVNTNIDDAVIIRLADGCPALTNVSVSCCWNLTDAAIIGLADRCPALTYIRVCHCDNLTDAAIIGLADRCPALTYVDMSNCNKLTAAAIIGLADRCPALIDVSVKHYDNKTKRDCFPLL